MGKYLGLDYGDKRIGLAITNEEKDFVFPRGYLDNHEVLSQLGDLIKEESIEKIIIGIPYGLKKNETVQTKKVREFIEKMKARFTLEIIEEDERFSTQAAAKILLPIKSKKRKKKIDQSSAILILQDYLAKHA